MISDFIEVFYGIDAKNHNVTLVIELAKATDNSDVKPFSFKRKKDIYI